MALEMHPITLNALKLGLFAFITAILLGLTYSGTKDRIAQAQLRMEQAALAEVTQSIEHSELLLEDRIEVPANYRALLKSRDGDLIQAVRNNNGEPIAFIVPSTAPDGYSGAIRMIVGIDLAGNITGVRVVKHAETPGLGDQVDAGKSNWIYSFAGRALDNPLNGWAVKKDGGTFDSFTGATITPRAVVKQVRQTLLFFREYGDTLHDQFLLAEQDQEVEQ